MHHDFLLKTLKHELPAFIYHKIFFLILAPGSNNKVKQLKEEVTEQEDVVKHLKRSKAERNLILEAANTLIALKKDLALAEVEELLEFSTDEPESDWKNDPVTGIDWSSVPVVHDALEKKFKKEADKLKLELDIEQKANQRLKQEVKDRTEQGKQQKSELEKKHKQQLKDQKEELEDKRKAELVEAAEDFAKRSKDIREMYKNTNGKLSLERAKSSKRKRSIEHLTSDRYTKRVQKRGIKEFVYSKFKGRAQRTCLLKNQKKARVDKFDICESLVLRALNRGCYNHLRKTGPIFYPSIATQDKHLNGLMPCKTG